MRLNWSLSADLPIICDTLGHTFPTLTPGEIETVHIIQLGLHVGQFQMQPKPAHTQSG